MDFIGEKCVCCGNEFEKDDDVVVCPECGSPHHRECYKKENRCANTELHITGEKWKRTKPEEKKAERIVCPHCGFPNNPPELLECVICGGNLRNREKQENIASENENIKNNTGFNLNEDMGGATLKEISLFVGPNTIYYIPVFKRMKDFGSKISFNFSCFLFPSFYFANRKMWLWAMISALIGIVLNLPVYVLVMANQGVFTDNIMNVIYENQNMIEELASICSWGSWLVRMIMCLFANWIYFKFAVKKLQNIKRNYSGRLSPRVLMTLGGVKPINIIVITLITLSLTLIAIVVITMLLNIMAVI